MIGSWDEEGGQRQGVLPRLEAADWPCPIMKGRQGEGEFSYQAAPLRDPKSALTGTSRCLPFLPGLLFFLRGWPRGVNPYPWAPPSVAIPIS